MVRLDVITTRAGDAGDTSLGDGSRVRKDHARIEALGAVDEANAAIGMLRVQEGVAAQTPRSRASRTTCSTSAPTCPCRATIRGYGSA
jgi:cob(I)alamin adenosyltransferase